MDKALKKQFVIFALPTLIAFSISFLIPFIMGVYLSFFEFTTVTNTNFVGIQNYIEAFQSEDFLNALWFTVKFALVSVVSIIYFSFSLAASHKKIKGNKHFPNNIFYAKLDRWYCAGISGNLS